MAKKSKGFYAEKEAIREVRLRAKKMGLSKYRADLSVENVKKTFSNLKSELKRKNATLPTSQKAMKSLYNEFANAKIGVTGTLQASFRGNISERPLSKTKQKQLERRIATQRRQDAKRIEKLYRSKDVKKASKKREYSSEKRKKAGEKLELADTLRNNVDSQRKQLKGDFLSSATLIKGQDYLSYISARWKSEYGVSPTPQQSNLAVFDIMNEMDRRLAEHRGAYGYVDSDDETGAYNYVGDLLDEVEREYFNVPR